MARFLLLNDIKTTLSSFTAGDILDDKQLDITTLQTAGAVVAPYVVAMEPLRSRFVALRNVVPGTETSILYDSLHIAGLVGPDAAAGLTYTVGPLGTGTNFTSIQTAIDDAELNLTPVSILVMAGVFTENLTISKPGINISGFTDRAKGQTQLIGNVTYNLDADGEVAFQQLDIDGQIIISGTTATQLYLIAVEVITSSANGAIDHVIASGSSTVIVEGNVRVTNNGTGPAYRSTNGGRFDGENCRLNASSTSNSAVVTSGEFIARNIETSGGIVYTGTVPFGLNISGSATNLVANAAVIDLTGTTQPSLVTDARMTSITNVDVFAGATPSKLTFSNIQVFAGFGTFDTTQGSRLFTDGILFKSGGAVTANFLNENGTYQPGAGAETLAQTLAAGNTSEANDLIMTAGQVIQTNAIRATDASAIDIQSNLSTDVSAGQRTFTIDAGTGSNGFRFDALAGTAGTSSFLFISNGLVDVKISDGVNSVGFDVDGTGGIRIFDSMGEEGLFYHADYSVNGLANKGDRWIPDVGYVTGRIADIDSITFDDNTTQSTGSAPLDLSYTAIGIREIQEQDLSAQIDAPRGLWISDNGLKLYVYDNTAGAAFEYNLSIPFDLTAPPTYTGNSLASIGRTGVLLRPDGTSIYFINFGGAIEEAALSTPFDLSTAGSITSTVAGPATPVDVSVYNGGTDVIYGQSDGTVSHWKMTIPWDWSTLIDTGETFATGFSWGSGGGIRMRPDGRRMIATDPVNRLLVGFTLDDAWDISTMRVGDSSPSAAAAPNDIHIPRIGDRIFTTSQFQSDSIVEYHAPVAGDGLFYTSDGVLDLATASRTVTIRNSLVSARELVFIADDGADQTNIRQSKTDIILDAFDTGSESQTITIDKLDITLTSGSGTLRGANYSGNYSINGIAVHGDRWIPDKGYVASTLGGNDVSAQIQTPGAAQDGLAVTWDNGASEYALTIVSKLKSTTVEVFSASDIDDLATAGVITLGAGETLTLDLKVDALTSSTRFVGGVGSQLRIFSTDSLSNYSYNGTGTFFSGNFNKIDLLNLNLTSTSTGDFLGVTMSTFGPVRIVNCTVVGFDSMGSVTGGVLLWRFASFVSLGSLTIVDTAISFLTSAFFFSPASGTLINMSGSPPFKSSITSCDIVLLASTAFVRIDPALSGDNDFIISGNQVDGGEIFDTSGTTGNFTGVSDASFGAESITSVTDSSGVARFNFAAPPALFVNQEVTIIGFVTNTAYNVTGLITATGAGFFEIAAIAFGTDEAGGTFTSDTVALTDVGTTLVDGDTLVIDTDGSTDYDGSAIVYNQLVNSFQINRVFTATAAGSWDTSGIDHTDPRILTHTNPDFAPSRYIAAAFVNDNTVAVGTIVNNTFTDLVFGTGVGGLDAATTIERLKLINGIDGTFEYTGNEPFEGSISFDFTVTSTGGTVDFRFRWQKDTGSGFVDLDNAVEALVAVGSDAQSVTKTFPLCLKKGDQIKPEITRNSGTSGITIRYATVYATG